MTKKILALPGDGVGPEVTSASIDVIRTATGDAVEILYGDIGITALEKTDNYLPAETVDLATDVDAIIAGVVIEQHNDRAYQNPIRVLKKQLGLYTIMRKFFPLRKGPGIPEIDLILMTGNSDALLNITETESLDGVNTQKFQSVNSCKKLFRKSMQIAELKQRRKITCAHRMSIFPESDGMFRDLFYEEMAGSRFLMEDMEIELAASELVMDPSSMDVIVSTDTYGVALAGVAAGMVGGSYVTPMGSLGETIGLFEPMHGPKLKLADSGKVNPTSAILSGAMALDYIGMTRESEMIRNAVYTAYSNKDVTPDVGGTQSTEGFVKAVIDAMRG